MGKKRGFEIRESLEELKNYIPKVAGYKPSKRLESLILIKSDKYGKLEEVATHLGITRRTLLNWINEYKSGGIDSLVSPATRNKPSKLITPEIHGELGKRLLSTIHIRNSPVFENIMTNYNDLTIFQYLPQNVKK